MLVEMRESALACRIVGAAYPKPDIHRDGRRRGIAHQDYFQSVIQRVVLNIELLVRCQARSANCQQAQYEKNKAFHKMLCLLS